MDEATGTIRLLGATLIIFGVKFDYSMGLYGTAVAAPVPVIWYYRAKLLDALGEYSRWIARGVIWVAVPMMAFSGWRVLRRAVDHAGAHDLGVWMIEASDYIAWAVLVYALAYGFHIAPFLRAHFNGRWVRYWTAAIVATFVAFGLSPNLL